MDDGFADQQLSFAALESLLTTLTLARRGDFSARMDGVADGIEGEVTDAINALMEVFQESTQAVSWLGQRVQDGQLASRAKVERAQGGLAEQIRAVNSIVAALSDHTQEVQLAVGQMTLGNLAVQLDTSPESVHRAGDLRQTADAVNKLAAHLKRLSTEMTRTLSSVGLEGRLNAEAHLGDLHGAWQTLVGTLNSTTKALSDQVGDLSETARALAAGSFSARANFQARGDLQPIRVSLNELGASIGGFCVGLRRVSSELVQQGRLDLVLRQPPQAGDLLHTFEAANNMLGTLTGLVREAEQSVTQLVAGNVDRQPVAREGEAGALARSICRLSERERRTQQGLSAILNGRFNDVRADGDARDMELFVLSTRLKHEWLRATHGQLASARARSASLAQYSLQALTCLTQTLNAAIGAYHVTRQDGALERQANLGCEAAGNGVTRPGEGLLGRVLLDKQPLAITAFDGLSVRIRSGMLEITPSAIVLYPVLDGDNVVAVVELAFTQSDGKNAVEVLDHVTSELATATARLARPADTVDDAKIATEKLAALEDELVIAQARLETLTKELQLRDQRIRALEANRAA